MKGTVFALCAIAAASASAIVPNLPITSFPGVGKMGFMSGATVNTQGTGAAVSPTWILTAWHVGGDRFEQNGQIYTVVQTVNHPTADLSLRRVSAPVQSALPMKFDVFAGTPPGGQTPLAGTILKIQGYGWTGTRTATGWALVDNSQGILRQCRNALDYYIPNVTIDFGGGVTKTSNYLFYDLDDPLGQSTVNILGGPAVGTDEGGMWTYDSGCPWTVFENGRDRQVGVGGIIGFFQGTGVVRAMDWGGFGGAAMLQSYESWIRQTVTDLGRAILNAPTYTIGSTLSGTVGNLYEEDTLRLKTRTFTSANDSDIQLSMSLTGNTAVSPATFFTVYLRGKCNNPLAQIQVQVRNQTTNLFETKGTFFISTFDSSNTVQITSMANAYVSPTGNVEVRIRAIPLGDENEIFETDWDVIRVTTQ